MRYKVLAKKNLNKQEIFNILKANEDQLKKYGVKKIGLFGSFVRNEHQKSSDLDFLVEFEIGKKTFKNFINLSYYLEDLFQRKVEIVTPEALSPYIGPHILEEAEYAII